MIRFILITILISVFASCKRIDPKENAPAEGDVEMFKKDSTILYDLKADVRELEEEIKVNDSLLGMTLWPAWSSERYEDEVQYFEIAERNFMKDSATGVRVVVATRQSLKERESKQLIVILSKTDSIGELSVDGERIPDVSNGKKIGGEIAKEYEMLRNATKGQIIAIAPDHASTILEAINLGAAIDVTTGEGKLPINPSDEIKEHLKTLMRNNELETSIEKKKEKMQFLREKWVDKLG